MLRSAINQPQDAANLDDLQQEHTLLERRLKELSKHLSLTPEEQYEAMVIKKRKLAIKDLISALGAQNVERPE